MEALHSRVAGIDVHKMLHVVTILIEQEDGQIRQEMRRFGGFKKDLRALTAWLQECQVEWVVMESTGIYWKSVYAHLEAAGIRAWVVNAHHIKQVPGRKTDVSDSAWLAQLGRFGLVKGSFIPDANLRELRLVSHYRRKLTGVLAGEKNRLHKVLDDAGIKLGDVVSDINGVSARAMVEGLIKGEAPAELARLGQGQLKKKESALTDAMEGGLSQRHRFMLEAVSRHIRYLEDEIGKLDRMLIEAMQAYAWAWQLLQTLPGLDEIGAAMILIEIGDNPAQFGSADRLASWAALCPGNNESAGKRKSGKTRHGNPVVRYLLCEAANAARATRSAFKARYESLVIRRGHKRAIIALAHKMIRTIYVMLARREPYKDRAVDVEAMSVAKNAPRWIKALKKFGYWPDAASA